MIRVKCFQFIIIVAIVVASESNNNKNNEDLKEDALPLDFANFVSGLHKMVFKSDSKKVTKANQKVSRKSSKKASNARRSHNIRSTQNAAMRDMLMMKLVSYYEDKYKLEHTTTASPHTIEALERVSWRATRQHTKTLGDDGVETEAFKRGGARRSFSQDFNSLDQIMQDPTPQALAEVVVI